VTTDKVPFVSIILPIRDESSSLAYGLRAILSQDYPADRMEILIADGMSTDDTREKIRLFIDSLPGTEPVFIVLDNAGKIVSTGLNLALRQAKGDIILRVDGHTIIASDYVRQCVDVLQRSGADNVGGRMNAHGRTVFGEAVALATSTPFGVGGARFHYSNAEEWVDTVYMGAWPRRVFEKIGLFDEELVRDQDDEFNYRLRKQGGRILLSPAIRSEYIVRSAPRALWLQYYQYGFWKVRVLQKHPRQMSLRQFVPPAFVLSLIISALLALSLLFHPFDELTCTCGTGAGRASSSSFIPFLSPFIFLLYLVANLFASIWTTIKKASDRSLLSTFFLLPPVFAILHVSYGLGFLAGLLKFAKRWGDNQGQTPILSGENA